MFTPLGSYAYPLEGDDMFHGEWREGEWGRYSNRYVRTKDCSPRNGPDARRSMA
jgi:hypothetical protein